MGWSVQYAQKTAEHHLAEVPSGKGIQTDKTEAPPATSVARS